MSKDPAILSMLEQVSKEVSKESDMVGEREVSAEISTQTESTQ